VPATISLTRSGFGIELRRGTFEFLVDGEPAGTIERDQTVETQIAPGTHTLLVRAGRYSSHERSFGARDDEVVNYRCYGTRIWPGYVLSIFLPHIGISLRRD
jgi:hypothetical protein